MKKLALILVLFASPAFAQTATTNALTSAQQKIMDALNAFNAQLGAFVKTDLDSAIADAKAQTPPDTAAIACWTAWESLIMPPAPSGASFAYAYQRVRDFEQQAPTINTNCAKMMPSIVIAFNNVIALAQKFGQ